MQKARSGFFPLESYLHGAVCRNQPVLYQLRTPVGSIIQGSFFIKRKVVVRPHFQRHTCIEPRCIVKDHPADQRHWTREDPVTPEHVVLNMTLREIQELLSDVRMSSDVITAQRLRRLVRELGQFELAIDAIGEPASLGNVPAEPMGAGRRVA